MTAIRDRQSDPDADDVPVAWDERPLVGARRGLPWWAAVLVGFGLAILGAFVDMMMQKDLGLLFKACYALGAVAAVVAVQRRGLFGPMVQPPLVLAVTVPGVILLTSDGSKGTDLLSRAFDVGTPLINGFPTMAITTGVTLAIGIFRIYRERDPDAPVKVKPDTKPERRDEAKPAARPAAAAAPGRGRPAARTGQTPPPPSRRGAPRDGAPPRRRPADDERRPRRDAEPGARKPPPPGRQPRRPRPEEGEPRRRDPRGESAPGAPRRRPPRSDDPRRGSQPPRRRPWDDER
ncbi:DUF6542 domain-containing protein [Amycolatopsis decaplanina]|uniref:DUF6542 domain-containing protein n=1 Tax=Amycolatopsis decaplanina DSM 44594 TaxID=1284240 RepID=M2Z9F7_9PSEU|nr:DUF6542 domain-containing protein [Amycolatopsis decaplanina]EME63927.1 hypothetical protein H074_04899 [Amycolatopsis decaplanina DSM 44594]